MVELGEILSGILAQTQVTVAVTKVTPQPVSTIIQGVVFAIAIRIVISDRCSRQEVMMPISTYCKGTGWVID